MLENFKKIQWDDNNFTLKTTEDSINDDLYISCISYEQRTTGILEKLDKKYKVDTGLFITNEKFIKYLEVKENENKIKNILKKSSNFGHTEFFLTSIDNPIKIILEIDKIIKKRFADKNKINVTFDITTFPRGEFLTILYFLRHLQNINLLRILYVSPKNYGNWLSKGYSRSMIPPFFEGPCHFEKKTALFILTGFEYDRAIELVDELEPTSLILGRPSPGTSEIFRDASEEIINKIKRYRRIIGDIHNIPANNPFLCKESIEKIIMKNIENYDFYIAPLGTKLEAMGVYLAYEKNQNFRIIYPLPLVYNIGDYSEGKRDVYEILLSDNGKK